jgi:hypothetical protein
LERGLDEEGLELRASLRTAPGFELCPVAPSITPWRTSRWMEVSRRVGHEAPRVCLPFELTWRDPLPSGPRRVGLVALELCTDGGRRLIFELPIVLSVATARGAVSGAVTGAVCPGR